ncbi:DUF7344 domain-containing protein [Natronobacterium texcoconense]|uniref:DUF7344 domain-containing protein n=1 Tax=Natronobacterium texcoconense TaxID=1095778 RepID=A0A1H0ZF65_NATTX|nr:helix-turn-helix transcriptional regulator [Natronobacterium texcoconense]SDQ26175.1 hypothetical protein SAMN04489842_0264 [Natronobacterium texcoconense]
MSSDAHIGGTTEQHPLDNVPTEQYDVFQHPRRVRLLAALEDLSKPSLAEITSAVFEAEAEDTAMPETELRREIRTTLVHNHIPRLVDHDIVEWDRTEGVVELHEPSMIQSAALTTLLEETDDEQEVLERVVDPLRLRLVDELADSNQPLSLEQLASTLAASDDAPGPDRTKVGLHHSHLPVLEETGVVEYDREGGLATLAEDVPELLQ